MMVFLHAFVFGVDRRDLLGQQRGQQQHRHQQARLQAEAEEEGPRRPTLAAVQESPQGKRRLRLREAGVALHGRYIAIAVERAERRHQRHH